MATTATWSRWPDRVSTWTRQRPLVVDCVLAAASACAVVAVWPYYVAEARATASPAAQVPWLVVSSAVLAHGAIVVRRVRPTVSFAVMSAATAVGMLTSIYLIGPSVLLFPLSLYSYCAYGRPPAPAVGLALSVGGAVVVTVAGFALAGRDMDSDLLMHVFVRFLPFVVAAWSLGMFRRTRLAHVAALEDRAVRAEAEREERARRAVADERARIAREMHDVVAHALSVVVSQANGGRYAARSDPERGVEALTTIAGTGRQALADMRGILAVLRGDGEHEQSPQPALRDLPELFDRVREAGVAVEQHERGRPHPLSPTRELAVFRLVQEALTNAVKHAGPGVRAEVDFVWCEDGLTVTVCDDGSGPGDSEGGQGLLGMRERLAVVGGSVRAGANPTGGFRVTARLPGPGTGQGDTK